MNIEKYLDNKKKAGLYRSLKNSSSATLNFSSNDYLGLSANQDIISATIIAAQKYGVGSGGSRLISGNHILNQEIEHLLAKYRQCQHTLLFNSGFQANISVIPTIADKEWVIIADKLVHNSIIQGALLSKAKFLRYKHNNLNHLEQLLKKYANKKCMVVAESIYSMTGDRANIDDIIMLSKQYDAFLMIDDAHAIGGYGDDGMGLTTGKSGIDIVISTFGKGCGLFGAAASCSQEIRDLLINACSGFIYTTALPPPILGGLKCMIKLLPNLNDKRKKLYSNARYMRNSLKNLAFDTGDSDTHIIPVIIRDNYKAQNIAEYLYDNGIFISAVKPPTVPRAILRVSVSSEHTESDIDRLCTLLSNYNE